MIDEWMSGLGEATAGTRRKERVRERYRRRNTKKFRITNQTRGSRRQSMAGRKAGTNRRRVQKECVVSVLGRETGPPSRFLSSSFFANPVWLVIDPVWLAPWLAGALLLFSLGSVMVLSCGRLTTDPHSLKRVGSSSRLFALRYSCRSLSFAFTPWPIYCMMS